MTKTKLSDRQREILNFGKSSLEGQGFVGPDAEQDAWDEHRLELLRAAGNARPAAYFKFELSENEPPWISNAEVLYRRGLAKDAAIEETCITLSPCQPAHLYREFLMP